jgi:ankyrin repeat protein
MRRLLGQFSSSNNVRGPGKAPSPPGPTTRTAEETPGVVAIDEWRLLHALQNKEPLSVIQDIVRSDPSSLRRCAVASGRLPLHIAAMNNASVALVGFLVQSFPQALEEKCEKGWLPLHVAASDSSVELVRFLVDQCPETLKGKTNAGWLPLHMAAGGASVEMARFLVDRFPKALE